MRLSSICLSILSMLSSSAVKVCRVFVLSLLSLALYGMVHSLLMTFLILLCSFLQQRPKDNDHYLKNCKNGRSPKETRWRFHDDKA